MRKTVLFVAALLMPLFLSAQQSESEDQGHRSDGRGSTFALSTNAVDYIYLGTFNLGAQVALDAKLSAEAVVKWNPFTFNQGQADKQFESRQRTVALGVRWWPWYTYSGWWVGGLAQYQEYNRGGIGTLETEEGDAFGAVIRGGYSLQIKKWFNLEFGLGAWGGFTKYTTYACPYCGRKIDEGSKLFFLPNEAMVSAVFIF